MVLVHGALERCVWSQEGGGVSRVGGGGGDISLVYHREERRGWGRGVMSARGRHHGRQNTSYRRLGAGQGAELGR